jgi:hypothetical protein
MCAFAKTKLTSLYNCQTAAHGKADDLVIKPVMTEVVPRLLAPLSMFDDKKAEEKKMIETEATVPALN